MCATSHFSLNTCWVSPSRVGQGSAHMLAPGVHSMHSRLPPTNAATRLVVRVQLLLPGVDKTSGVGAVPEEQQACSESVGWCVSVSGGAWGAWRSGGVGSVPAMHSRNAGLQNPTHPPTHPPMFIALWMASTCSSPSSPGGLEGARSSDDARMWAVGKRSK